uniref:Single-stranded DNA-binding protein n=1 Tax=Ochrobactrum phage ORM_20 TaxID=2985243 RepID=A0A9N6WZQ7_9VIRU|nr:single strand DNA binding protein [Ochrobactrum phage ORM_20]
MSFAELKKRAKDIDSIAKEIVQEEGDSGDRFLSIGIDKVGVAYCRGRFMPAPSGEKLTMVTQEKFNFKNADGTKEYYALSLRNLPDPENPSKRLADPVQKYLDVLWKAEEKDLYTKRKKKAATYLNFYVIEDKVNPENNGKVFLWRIPFAVKKKIELALKPEVDKYDPSRTPKAFNPFDLFGEAGGRDFIIRIKDSEGKNDYSDSHFMENSTPFLDADGEGEEAKAAYEACHSLFHFVDPARHKTREELITQLIDVLGPNDKYLQVAYPDECEEFKVKGKGKKKSEDKKSEDKDLDLDKTEDEVKEEPKRETKAPKSSKSDDLEIDF